MAQKYAPISDDDNSNDFIQRRSIGSGVADNNDSGSESSNTLHNRFPNVAETQNFDQFNTIDRMSDNTVTTNFDITNNDRKFLTGRYKKLLWEKGKMFITLTCIAITIGCIAGFIQIFTETLVNWKTGHCSRNFLLNKSFCCSEITSGNMRNELSSKRNYILSKREEYECIDQGLWVERTGLISPFIIFIGLSVTFATMSTLMVTYLAPMATGSGITEIKVWVSGFEYRSDFLNGVTLIVKSIALPLAISAGLSIGKEGPSVHYATCCGYIITRWLLKDSLTYSTQFEYLTAASGAGVAVAFGAPIGGVLFGIEEIAAAAEFNTSTLWKSYYVALVGVTTLKIINPFRNGQIIQFNVTYDKDWRINEIPVFIILGIFGGLYGKFVSSWNISYVNFRRKYLSRWPMQEVIILALLTSFISYFNEFLKLDMTESMGILFHECLENSDNENSSVFGHRLCQLDENTHVMSFLQVLLSLLAATLIRSLLVIISYGAKVPAGIFVPSMAVGATFGRALSLIVERFFTGTGAITPGTYAFLGATATLCGITNLTLTVVVIMFELTGAFIYIIPTMIVVAIVRIILSNTGVAGIADQMVFVNGFPLYEKLWEEEEFMDDYTAEDVMSSQLITLKETTYVSELEAILYDSNDKKNVKGFPIIKDGDELEADQRCVGYVLRKHLTAKLLAQDISSANAHKILISFTASSEESLHNSSNTQITHNICFKDIVNTSPITVKPTVPTSLLFTMFKQMGCKTIIVEKDGILQGLVTGKDILKFERTKACEVIAPKYTYNEKLNQIFWSMLEPIIKRVSKI
ncbi:Gef1p NDAI_0G04800 [Naumovozyma dairenensis CBS 421]|uniref:Chloride channel protein n=1 Tax=Naumovozyma dairenensis (strain ATCC 10597 / BCRC 20456 / CBS 421 / NBRC 0211 / NRRL Y-12639) TaxID=1071378 RepID=J7SB12_NAUDC|nr:hypothetical protein NDAI_0G04800 [Naumovozyma dairenensis CBS 421]CCK73463.1 hypothetical protein NDAI_0G04800 [Naumovozyma dairenensis CBS 421]